MTGQEQALEQKVEEAIESEDLPILGINIQGDGANISSETSQVQLVFSILNEGMDVLKPSHHHCFAIMVNALSCRESEGPVHHTLNNDSQ
jgi:hypothetical protein